MTILVFALLHFIYIATNKYISALYSCCVESTQAGICVCETPIYLSPKGGGAATELLWSNTFTIHLIKFENNLI